MASLRGTVVNAAVRHGFLAGAGRVGLVILGCAAIFLLPGCCTRANSDPCIYLTWERDPCTTMVVTAIDADTRSHSFLEWEKDGSGQWHRSSFATRAFPFLSDWKISRLELEHLEPGTRYRFRLDGAGRERIFDTLPARLDKPVVFVEGGDVGLEGKLMDKMNRLAGSLSPSFVVMGGDLAYAEADPAKAWRWLDFFGSSSTNLVAPDGRLIPIIVTVGNHDADNSLQHRNADFVPPRTAEERRKCAPYVEAFFPLLIDRGYASIDFGDYLSLLLLDTRHLCEIGGPQTSWLEQALASRRNVPNVFPVYHVPAYPCRKIEPCLVTDSIRADWLPLFEKNGIRIAFEHDSHAFKVTHPIKEGRVDPAGIIYLGDGAWGVPPREEKPGEPPPWYIEKTLSVNHIYKVLLSRGKRSVRALDIDGRELYRLGQASM